MVAHRLSAHDAHSDSVPAGMILTLDVGIVVEKHAAISAEKNIVGIDHLATNAFHECDTAFSDEWSPDVV
jgi:tRNA A37 threonylcarbamoyltransferase TsaD